MRKKFRVNVGKNKVMSCSRYGNGDRRHVILNREPRYENVTENVVNRGMRMPRYENEKARYENVSQGEGGYSLTCRSVVFRYTIDFYINGLSTNGPSTPYRIKVNN